MKKENKPPVIHQHADYFAAKSAAREWFKTKHNHDCGTLMDEKRETPEGLYISFRSQQDPNFGARYQVLIK
jgi:hypothetical protein